MKFNVPQPPVPLLPEGLEPVVGNVYACKGGGKTRYWIVIGISDRTVNLVGVNSEGAVSSTVNYGVHVFTNTAHFGRELLGRVDGLGELAFDITWINTP